MSYAKGLRTHYAQRIFRSVAHLGQTIWQPICGISNVSKITMTTVLKNVNCLRCRNVLWQNRGRLGIGRQINKVRREGKWKDDAGYQARS